MYYLEFDSQQGSFDYDHAIFSSVDSAYIQYPDLIVQRDGSGALFFNDIVSYSVNDFIYEWTYTELIIGGDCTSDYFSVQSYWSHAVNSGYYEHTSGSNDSMYQVLYFTSGDYISPTFDLLNVSSGSARPYAANGYGSWVSSDGTYSDFFQTTLTGSHGFGINADTLFVGGVDNLSFKKMLIAATISNSMQQLSDGYMLGINISDAIEICPLWNYSKEQESYKTDSRALASNLYRTTLGGYNRIAFDVNFLTSEHMTYINSWWESGAELFFFITSDTVTEVHTVVLMGDDSPIRKYQGNTGYFKGSIELESF